MSSCLMRLRQNMATCGLLMSLAKITSTRANILPRWFYPPRPETHSARGGLALICTPPNPPPAAEQARYHPLWRRGHAAGG